MTTGITNSRSYPSEVARLRRGLVREAVEERERRFDESRKFKNRVTALLRHPIRRGKVEMDGFKEYAREFVRLLRQ
jgi:hypothetical protein